MKKMGKVAIILMMLLLGSSIAATVNSQNIDNQKVIINGENNTIDDPISYLNITKPRIGYLCVFGNCIPIYFLIYLRWGVVIDSQLCVETDAPEIIDYVKFEVTSNKISPDLQSHTKMDYDYPFNCCFDNLSADFNYVITANAYRNDTIIAEDEVSPIAYFNFIPINP